jgi:uncharacterized protein (DUF58 family)
MVLPTPRLSLAVLGLGVVAGVTAFFPSLLWGWLACCAALFGAVVWDLSGIVRPSSIRVTRSAPPVMSHGAANRVVLTLEHSASRVAEVLLEEVWPPSVAPQRTLVTVRVPPRAVADVSYTVTPSRRGALSLAPAALRTRGPLGLVAMQSAGAVAGSLVRVYPKLTDVARYELAARRSLRADVGLSAIRALGPGTEIEGLRDYAPDDEYRRIDWKATARRGRPVTRELRDERTQHVTILIDAGRLGAAELGTSRRIDHAVNSALLLANVASVRGDRVGVLVFDREVRRYVPPSRASRAVVPRIARALFDVDALPVEPDYERAFRYLLAHDRRRSLLVLFSDVLSPEGSEALVAQLAQTRGRHLPLCVAIADPALLAAASRPIRTAEDVYHVAAARELCAEREATLRAMRARGVLTVDVPPDRATPTVVSRYLELKARRLL